MTPQSAPPNPTSELVRAVAWLTGAVFFALPVSLWWGHHLSAEVGMIAGLAAAGLCWVGSLIALLVRMIFSRPQEVVVSALGAMLIRMMLILGGGVVIASIMPRWVEAGFWGQGILFFLLTLFAETLLAVRWVRQLDLINSRSETEESSSLPTNGVKAV